LLQVGAYLGLDLLARETASRGLGKARHIDVGREATCHDSARGVHSQQLTFSL
jgi:hypothetical protein